MLNWGLTYLCQEILRAVVEPQTGGYFSTPLHRIGIVVSMQYDRTDPSTDQCQLCSYGRRQIETVVLDRYFYLPRRQVKAPMRLEGLALDRFAEGVDH